jgi:putative tryptophan/tyrosine transport system substrate-binding protein
MTTRRQFVLVSALGVIAPSCASAQARPVRIGMLSSRPLAESLFASGIVRALAQLGYREGAGMTLEFRSADSIPDRFAKLAGELVALKCDLIFAVGSEVVAQSLRDQRVTTPIVIVAADYDPVAKGIVQSMSRPGGNITGIYMHVLALVPKRLEILREVVPSASRFLVFADSFSRDQLAPLERAAIAMRVTLTTVQFAKQPYDLAAAFETGRGARVQGLILLTSPVLAGNLSRVASLAAKHRLPAIGFVGTADAGFLLSYSNDNRNVPIRAAELAATILRGADPANIPIEQMSEFELVVNSKTARALGVKIPYSVMARAARVIE